MREEFLSTPEKKAHAVFSDVQLSKKRKLLLISGIVGAAIIGITFQLSQTLDQPTIRDIGIVIGILVGIIPYVIMQSAESRKHSSIDMNLPMFLLALVGAVKSGTSLLRAIEESADRNLGGLTPELKNLRANISWGMPFEEAFENFKRRVGTQLAQRVAVMIQIAIKMGGDIAANLEVIQTHVSEMQNIEKERKASLTPYIFVIYISFVVFIVVSVLVAEYFFTEIANVQEQLIESSERTGVPLGMFRALLGIDVDEINGIILNMALIEAVFGGLAAGKIGEGSFVAGIKHIVIMIVITVVSFIVI